MAQKIPLVLGTDGRPQRLQAGDTLLAPQSGGDETVLANDETSAVVVCAPVYLDANDAFKRAQANATATTEVYGLVSQAPSIASGGTGPVRTSGVLAATAAQWDAAAGTTGGLARGTIYFLDPANPGKLTATVPTAAGQYVAEVGVGQSTTELLIRVKSPILL